MIVTRCGYVDMCGITPCRGGQVLTARMLKKMITDQFMATGIGGGGSRIRRMANRVVIDGGGRIGGVGSGGQSFNSKWVRYST